VELGVNFKILGPLEVADGDRPIPLEGMKPRMILCALLVSPNDVVSIDRLIDWLWPPRQAPESAAAIIQAHVSRLRRRLEPHRRRWAPAEVLVRRAPGYLLRVEPDQVDALRFTRLVDEGREALERGAPEIASTVLGRALRLWRGSALADVALVEMAQDAIARLDAQHLSARVMLMDADLALGRHAALVPELEALVRTHPFDERLSGQLMLALYRSGRQADSLAVYQRVHELLAVELDISPGPVSRRLRAAILAQDPCLDLPRS
jgi:DNA-binding SARP family transcriptional activator